MNACAFYKKNRSWGILEAHIKLRDLNQCQRCHKRRNLTVHHLKPREVGGLDEERNLTTLCVDCHNFIEETDPVWTEIKKERPKFIKNQKKGTWSRNEYGLVFTHDNNCKCGC